MEHMGGVKPTLRIFCDPKVRIRHAELVSASTSRLLRQGQELAPNWTLKQVQGDKKGRKQPAFVAITPPPSPSEHPIRRQ